MLTANDSDPSIRRCDLRDIVTTLLYTSGYLIVTSTAVWLIYQLVPAVIR